MRSTEKTSNAGMVNPQESGGSRQVEPPLTGGSLEQSSFSKNEAHIDKTTITVPVPKHQKLLEELRAKIGGYLKSFKTEGTASVPELNPKPLSDDDQDKMLESITEEFEKILAGKENYAGALFPETLNGRIEMFANPVPKTGKVEITIRGSNRNKIAGKPSYHRDMSFFVNKNSGEIEIMNHN